MADLGITPEGWQWQVGQRELVQRIVDSPSPIVMVEAECGSGKSLVGLAAAAVADAKTLLLIQTIQLQEQYLRDFDISMMVGRRNFTCDVTGKSAEHAPCTVGIQCELKGTWKYGQPLDTPSCAYFRRKAENALAKVSIQNYAFWLAETKGDTSTFSRADWIICDEAHEIDQICMAAGTIELLRSFLLEFEATDPPTEIEALSSWADATYYKLVDWAKAMYGIVIDNAEHTFDVPPAIDEAEYQTVNRIRRTATALYDLSNFTDDDLTAFVVDDNDDTYYYVKPIFGKYGFQRIRNAGQKIILMSAFLAPELLVQTLDLDPEDVDIIRPNIGFDRSKSPVVYAPTVGLRYNSPEIDYRYVGNVVDSLAGNEFAESAGFIHVPSVALRNRILNSLSPRVRSRVITYDAGGKADAIMRFKTAAANGAHPILLGQSISTGVDIPHIPKWQIIVKMPYMPLQDPAILARKDRDPNFYTHYTICEIVQATGRVKRAKDHDGVTVILDSGMEWFFNANWKHFPKWFLRSFSLEDGWNQFPVTSKKFAADRLVRRNAKKRG